MKTRDEIINRIFEVDDLIGNLQTQLLHATTKATKMKLSIELQLLVSHNDGLKWCVR